MLRLKTIFLLILLISIQNVAKVAEVATRNDCALEQLEMLKDPAILKRVELCLNKHPEGDKLRDMLTDASCNVKLALQVLLAWMPVADYGSLSSTDLLEHVKLALNVWQTSPWRQEISPELFAHYVLPYRVSQEELQPYQRVLQQELLERITGLDLEQSLLEVNRWSNEGMQFVSTSARDQGPLTSLQRGWGRCEERMILSISALRAVGIPARTCSTPWWTTTDNNHAWLEAWAGLDRGWVYLEACDGSHCVNQAWFSHAASRAGMVLSRAWGEYPSALAPGDRLLKYGDGVTTINSTHVYAETGVLEIPPIEDSLRVTIYAWNYGCLMPFTSVLAGSQTEMGPGDYIISAELEDRAVVEKIRIRPGSHYTASLDSGIQLFDRSFWLRYPMPPASEFQCDPPDKMSPRWLNHELKLAQSRMARTSGEAPGHDWIIFLLSQDNGEALEDAMVRAGSSRGKWEEAVMSIAPELGVTALALITQMDDKDFHEANPDSLSSLCTIIQQHRQSHCPDLPDSLWENYVLSPRLYYQAGSMEWWRSLPLLPPGNSARKILKTFRNHVSEVPRSTFGAISTPGATWRAGLASLSAARACLVGLLRVNGIPARALRGHADVEYWDAKTWQSLRPFPTDDNRTDREQEASCYLDVYYTRLGAEFTQVASWRHTNLMTFEDGRFRVLYTGQLDESNGHTRWQIPPGTYWLSGSQRNGQGEVKALVKKLELTAGDTLRTQMEIGIELKELDEASLVSRTFKKSQDCTLRRNGISSTLRQELGPEATLIVIHAPGQEAGIRHLGALRSTKPGANLLLLTSAEPESKENQQAWLVDPTELQEVFGIRDPALELPLSILINAKGDTRLWVRGMQPGLADIIPLRLEN